jgi:tetratricopeptide (TPR) repeat protein
MLIFTLGLTAQNMNSIRLDIGNGNDGCKKCFHGNISKNRKCDNCDGYGQIKFTETCKICDGRPGGCKENAGCNGDCHECEGGGETLGDGVESKCPECSGSGKCAHCRGQGQIWGRDCKFCNGNGKCQAANNCYGSGTLLKYPRIKCSTCRGTGKCLNRYLANDYKCHGKGEIHFTVQKNPNITQADKDELAAYISQLKIEEEALEQKRAEELALKAKEAAIKAEKEKQNEASKWAQNGHQYFNQNKFNDALKSYNQSLSIVPNNEIELKKNQVLIILDSIKSLGNYQFNYLDFPKTGIADFQKNYKSQLFKYYSGPSATCKVTFTSNGQGKLGLALDGFENKKLADSIIAKPFRYPNPAAKYGYYVNAKTSFEYQIITQTKLTSIKIKKGIIQTDNNSASIASIRKSLPDSIDGKYRFNVGTISIDGETKSMTPEFKSYKSYGGPGTALYSVLLPGLGKSIITRSSKGIGTLLFTGGATAAGFYLKNKANANYNRYMNAQTQTDMDLYYDKYKNNIIGMKLCLGTAATIWLLDIYSVYLQGKYNHHKERKLKPSFAFNQYQRSLNLAIQIK